LKSRKLWPGWRAILTKQVAHFPLLPPAAQNELLGDMQVFLAEKRFEGCGGLTITLEIKVTIAGEACLLLLHRDADYFPLCSTILVYPHPFASQVERREPGGVVTAAEQVRLGESWHWGAVILAWDEVLANAHNPTTGHNVVLHEFAHQLDEENGVADGLPRLAPPRRQARAVFATWARVMGNEYQHLIQDIHQHHRTVIDAYGATNPAEFFAVVTETFFEKPRALQARHPALYEQLRTFYHQDPAAHDPRSGQAR
jgi:Mlc titration factor MtfA (ptsG expression regulator)